MCVRERDNHIETNIYQLPPVCALTGNWTCNLGMCSDLGIKPATFHSTLQTNHLARISLEVFSLLLLLFKYSCLHFLPTTLLCPHPCPTPTLHPTHLGFCSQVLYTCSLVTLPLLSPTIPLLPSLWLPSLCSLFQCLWLYFACLFVLLLRFHW